MRVLLYGSQRSETQIHVVIHAEKNERITDLWKLAGNIEYTHQLVANTCLCEAPAESQSDAAVRTKLVNVETSPANHHEGRITFGGATINLVAKVRPLLKDMVPDELACFVY
jgi:hypothetical protein